MSIISQYTSVLVSMVTINSFLAVCDVPNRNDLLKLIISSLDFSQDVYARVVLTKVLTAGDQVSCMMSWLM